MNTRYLVVGLLLCISYSDISHAAESDDAQRIEAVGRAVSALEAMGAELGTYTVPNAGHKNSGSGWFHYEGGTYDSSIANRLVSLGHLTTPAPKDPDHPQPGIYNPFDFLVYRCRDRIAVFSKADTISPSTQDQTWWNNNNCTQYPINNLDHPFFILSSPVQLNDDLRAQEVARVVSALEAMGGELGTYTVPNAGHNNNGSGWFHYQGGTYQNSIANSLVSLGHLTSPVPKDPGHQQPGTYSQFDFLVYRCRDRVAVFSKADTISPSAQDQSWWQNNNCTQYPINSLDHTFFILSSPVQLNDDIRFQEVARAVAALEAMGTELGTYKVPNAGHNNTGSGWFHYEGGTYENSIANRLVSLGHLNLPVPKDPNHPQPGIYNPFDFLVYRCRDRIAVFSKADTISPSTQDQNWWQSNNCSQYPINNLDHPFFILSKSINRILKPALNLSNFDLVFSDEFNGSSLDPTKWDTGMLWGPYQINNNEEQLYVDTLGMHSEFGYSPFKFTGSTLKITATPTSPSLPPPARPAENDPIWRPRPYTEYRFNGPTDDGPGYRPSDVNYLSGIITSYDSLKMTHGYVETRAKLPAGRGLWPAFWMLNTHYVENVPEIDIMEFLGQETDRVYHTYHYFDIEDNWRKTSTPSYITLSSDWTNGFNTYGMAWSPTEIIWYVNGVETKRITRDEFTIPNQSMYLLANLAVGGNWAGAPDTSSAFPASFEIDYIRAYKRKLQPQLNLGRDYQLMFEDNFDGSTLDRSKWKTHFIWGPYLNINNEQQYYVDALSSDKGRTTPSNTPFVLNDGILSITARQASDPNSFPIRQKIPGINARIWTNYPEFQRSASYSPGDYTSGIITSYDSFQFSYGYAEIRAKIPSGDGLWPAFWLLNGYYINRQPEIDIMEVRGEFPTQIVHSYHALVDTEMTLLSSATTNTPSVDYSQNFHKYGVRWQPGRIDWYLDGELVHTYSGADVGYQVMYLIANLAVGGDFNNGTPVDNSRFNTSDPVSLDIDYIRVYQEKHRE